jgi:MFS family permease
LGALSDRYGRKPVLTVSLSIAVAAYVPISLGIELRSLALIAIGCLIGDLAESNIAIERHLRRREPR